VLDVVPETIAIVVNVVVVALTTALGLLRSRLTTVLGLLGLASPPSSVCSVCSIRSSAAVMNASAFPRWSRRI
jgi:hypothetical protein